MPPSDLVLPTPHVSPAHPVVMAELGNMIDDVPATVRLRGATLHTMTEAQCVCHILSALSQQHGGSVITMNLDQREFYFSAGWATGRRSGNHDSSD
jgi:hypothetical protein